MEGLGQAGPEIPGPGVDGPNLAGLGTEVVGRFLGGGGFCREGFRGARGEIPDHQRVPAGGFPGGPGDGAAQAVVEDVALVLSLYRESAPLADEAMADLFRLRLITCRELNTQPSPSQ